MNSAVLAVTAPEAGAAKPGDTAQAPMPKPTNAAMKIARISLSLVLEGRRPRASHGLTFGHRVLRSEIGRRRHAASVDWLLAKSPRTATTNAIGTNLRSAVRTARG